MLKIRTWSNIPSVFEDLLPTDAPPAEIVDDEASPLRGELADLVNILDHEARFAYRDQGKVFVLLGAESCPEVVPDDLVHLVPAAAFDAWKRQIARGPCFFTD